MTDEVENLRSEIAALRHELRRLETMNEALLDAGKTVVRERDELRLRLASLGEPPPGVGFKITVSDSYVTPGDPDASRDGSGPEDVQTTKEKG